MKINSRYLLFIFMLSCIAITIGCVSYVKMSSENMAPAYEEDFQPLCQSAYIVHQSDSLSELILKLDPDGFLYKREKPSEPFMADATIRIVLFDSYSDNRWKDSTGISIRFEKDSIQGLFQSKIPLQLNTGQNTIAYVAIRDNNKDSRQTLMLLIDKTGRFGSQWFVPDEATTGIPSAFTINAGSDITFAYHGDSPDKMKCYYFNDSFPLPSPPYALENIVPQKLDPDSVFNLLFQTDIGGFCIKTKKTGLYFFSADPSMAEGFTVVCTAKGFPDINTHAAMLKPIRYISTQKEFRHIAEANNTVAAIEGFWLKIGKQEERTRNLIRKYYSRVMNANRLFTSYTEGWQTDRGMIYIVFGPPNIAYRSDENESWIYGEENNFFSITFTFEKIKNKFSSNDYSLQRAPVYKDNWFRAVDIWRQ